jgi:hypothetical protein
MPLQFSRHYTLAEARELLPTVRGWFAQMDAVRPRVREAEEVFGPRLAAGEDLGGPATIAFVRDLGQLHGLLREFHSRNIQLKDSERGLVDFPAQLDGREVFLCWEKSEADITHWHAIDEGFAERQPLWDRHEG